MLAKSCIRRLPASRFSKPDSISRLCAIPASATIPKSQLFNPQFQHPRTQSTPFRPRSLHTTCFRPQNAPSPQPSPPTLQRPNEQVSSTTHKPPPSTPLPHKPAPHRNPDEPIYQLTFTCKPCGQRSSHTVSKQGYHHGTVLIQCPSCQNRHLIADHLHIFSDKSVTVEDIMRQKGEDVQRGSISMDGDVEFWGDSDAKAS